MRELLPVGPAEEPLFVSTRDPEGKNLYKWDTVLEMGLSADYGLFMPYSMPVFSEKAVRNLSDLSYHELAWVIMRRFLPQGDIPDDVLADICEGAYSDIYIPLEEAMDDNNLVIARLDRGPSCSFKDFAALFLARLMSRYLSVRQ